MQERVENWIILGREIGSATGWDQYGNDGIQLYDFIPNPNVRIPPAHPLCIDFEEGIIETFNDTGELIFRLDMVSVLRELPRKQEITEN